MHAEAIQLDETSRGLIQTFFYPVSYVQVFRPCNWEQFDEFIWEDDKFHIMMCERIFWLDDQKIKHVMRYDIASDNPEMPHRYRLYVEFSRKKDAEAYRIRWT